MTKTSKIVLAILAVIAIAVLGGYLGSGFRGAPAAVTGGAEQGAFIEKIKERGELRVGVAIAPPMTVQNADGTLGGANLIPLQQLADQLDVKLVPVAAEWKNIVAGLQADRYDFAANLDYTVERSLAIQFSDPVYSYPGVFVVKADSDYVSANDLIEDGGQISVAQGAAPAVSLAQFTDKIMPMDNYSNAISAVKANRAIAEFTDLPTAESQALADESLKIIVPEPAIFQSSTGYGVPADTDPRSLQIVNIAIDRAKSEGVLTKAYAEAKYVEADNLGDLRKK